MDVLVVVGDTSVPERLRVRARRVVRTAGAPGPGLVADLRSHIPREVGVFGAGAEQVAETIHRAGIPVSVCVVGGGSRTPPPGSVPIRDYADPGPGITAADSLLDLVGHTPLVRLDRSGRDLRCHLLAKLELLNPGGSVKDRPAVAMIDAAERDGLLQPGGTIVEPTSGNTGVGLAIVAARRGYHCVFVMPDKMSHEKIALLRAFGAEVVICPTAVAPDHAESYYSVADRLTAEIPGAFQPNQYRNQANPESHERTTGPEIWEQTGGLVTHFVAGIGTGGTITGVGRYLKPRGVTIVGADPEGSVYSGGQGRPYLVEGIGEDFWPSTYDPSIVDRVVMVSDRDSFLTARRVTREEGILVGGSAGTAVWAALQIGRELTERDVVVVLIPDSGRAYLSKVYDDAWMTEYGFLRGAGRTVADVLHAKRDRLPALVHVHPGETVRQVIETMRSFDVSQVPVLKAEPPLAAAEVVGAVRDRELLDLAFRDPDVLDRPVGNVMGPPLPTVGSGEPVDRAVPRLEGAPAMLVLDAGHPVGIVSRSDLIDFLTR